MNTSLSTTNPLIQQHQNTNDPSSAIVPFLNDGEGASFPVAAIVIIAVACYVILMFIIFALVRCYCGKQCSTITCTCCGKPDVCCTFEGKRTDWGACCANNESTVACITCACCDRICLPRKDVDCVGIILCDRCLGENGCCSCGNMQGCDCQCNLDCDTINCLCFQIHRTNRPPSPPPPYKNYSNNASTETFKQPPSTLSTPSTGGSVIVSAPTTGRSLSPLFTDRSFDVEAKSTQTPRNLYPVIDYVHPSLSTTRSTKSTKSSVAPHTNKQLFAPRNAAQLHQKKSGAKTPRSTRDGNTSARGSHRSTTPLNEREEYTNRSETSRSKSDTSIIDIEDTESSTISPHPGRVHTSKSANSANTTLESSRKISSRSIPMSSSSNQNSSLNSTSEALLAQYQLMDASKLSSSLENNA
ncbi:uncharacterized protein LOC126823316 isoform X2 [Patella vulgata]|uniref:uncharacterized protein LOC126823316 isoform X2 n=1 Tax=Patella vulgata TaxID=6465 RepID=UPI00218094DC|nr:uncharacterized protein LOC126823316 isoform X2 [Patella vulgata]